MGDCDFGGFYFCARQPLVVDGIAMVDMVDCGRARHFGNSGERHWNGKPPPWHQPRDIVGQAPIHFRDVLDARFDAPALGVCI